MNDLNLDPNHYDIILEGDSLTHRPFSDLESNRDDPTIQIQKKMMLIATDRLATRPNDEYTTYAKVLLKRFGSNPAIEFEATLLRSIVERIFVNPTIQNHNLLLDCSDQQDIIAEFLSLSDLENLTRVSRLSKFLYDIDIHRKKFVDKYTIPANTKQEIRNYCAKYSNKMIGLLKQFKSIEIESQHRNRPQFVQTPIKDLLMQNEVFEDFDNLHTFLIKNKNNLGPILFKTLSFNISSQMLEPAEDQEPTAFKFLLNSGVETDCRTLAYSAIENHEGNQKEYNEYRLLVLKNGRFTILERRFALMTALMDRDKDSIEFLIKQEREFEKEMQRFPKEIGNLVIKYFGEEYFNKLLVNEFVLNESDNEEMSANSATDSASPLSPEEDPYKSYIRKIEQEDRQLFLQIASSYSIPAMLSGVLDHPRRYPLTHENVNEYLDIFRLLIEYGLELTPELEELQGRFQELSDSLLIDFE